jgi:hypothetical protein
MSGYYCEALAAAMALEIEVLLTIGTRNRISAQDEQGIPVKAGGAGRLC